MKTAFNPIDKNTGKGKMEMLPTHCFLTETFRPDQDRHLAHQDHACVKNITMGNHNRLIQFIRKGPEGKKNGCLIKDNTRKQV